MGRLRILVADNSATYKKMFASAAAELDNSAVVTSISDGDEALEKIKRCDYEIIIIDAEVSDIGLLLRKIKLQIPKAFVLITARPSQANDELCAQALVNGAADYLVKPIQSSYNDNYDVIKDKMADIFSLLSNRHSNNTERVESEQAVSKKVIRKSRFYPGIVLIAASTGGPAALEKIIPNLSKCFPVPILIVQHMLLQFTDSLAQNLDQKSQLRVKVAEDSETVEAGTVYLAPGGTHMLLDAKSRIRLSQSPPMNGVRPAADMLFESVADSLANRAGVLAVILTGMGQDGARGLGRLKEKQSCLCLAQSEETCIVYGMPRVAAERGFVDKILDLDEIAIEIERLCFAKG